MSHEFFLNGHPSNPYCAGVQGVVEAYHTALRAVQLWGPTNFAPIIKHVARFAAEAKTNPQTMVRVMTCEILCKLFIESRLSIFVLSALECMTGETCDIFRQVLHH